MAGTKEIKRRIKSVKNTKKITKAMELVAASKMKRAVSSTLASRLYAEYSWEVLKSIADSRTEITHPLFIETESEIKNILLVLVTSNRGLCGAYNAQALKKSLNFFKDNASEKFNYKTGTIDVVTVGKRGDTAMRRLGKNVVASFVDLPNIISLYDIAPISRLVLTEFSAQNYDKIFMIYTDYISALSQKPNIKQLLPIKKDDLKELIEGLDESRKNLDKDSKQVDYLIEGDINLLAGSLAEKVTQMQIYQMLLESNASEQSARMVAMKNASEASGEMIDDLTLVFNKARQSNITREISEISAGMAAAE